jgi:hypothetical protein
LWALYVPSTRWTTKDSRLMAFQKELYNFESLYKYIQRIDTKFLTVIMWQNIARLIQVYCSTEYRHRERSRS